MAELYREWGLFQSTLLMRGATRSVNGNNLSANRFQSTLLMRGATAVFVIWLYIY